jgi:LAS superfamily LD-carboxypeptidase LdcB
MNSGFRSYPEQKFLWDGYQRKLPGFNLAAKPGISNHQSGIAFDLDVAGGPGNQTYDWLAKRGPAFGFFRTVNKEFWHWECDPVRATRLASNNTFKTSNVVV